MGCARASNQEKPTMEFLSSLGYFGTRLFFAAVVLAVFGIVALLRGTK
jgi:hypothetical protein